MQFSVAQRTESDKMPGGGGGGGGAGNEALQAVVKLFNHCDQG